VHFKRQLFILKGFVIGENDKLTNQLDIGLQPKVGVKYGEAAGERIISLQSNKTQNRKLKR